MYELSQCYALQNENPQLKHLCYTIKVQSRMMNMNSNNIHIFWKVPVVNFIGT